MNKRGRLHSPAASPQGKNSSYTLSGRLGAPQNWAVRCGENKNSWPLIDVIFFFLYPASTLVTVPLSYSRFPLIQWS